MSDDLPDDVRDVVLALLELTPEKRKEVFAQFCIHCGAEQPETARKCQCWNDE